MKFRQQIELTLALALLSACGALSGCGAAQVAPSEAQLVCYAQADQVVAARVDAECGGHLTNCAAKDAIVSEMRQSLEACK